MSSNRSTDRPSARTHKLISGSERQAIRKKYLQDRQLTQRQLALWASGQFGRHISQSTVSDSLHKKYSHLDMPLDLHNSGEGAQARTFEIDQQVNDPDYNSLSDEFSGRCRLCGNSSSGYICPPAWSERLHDQRTAAPPVLHNLHASASASTQSSSTDYSRPSVALRSDIASTFESSETWFPMLADVLSTAIPTYRGSCYTDTDLISTLFDDLGSMMGRDRILDEALQAFAVHRMGILRNNDQLILHKARVQYGHAIRELKAALDTPGFAPTLEIITATMIMSLYELAAKTGNGAWLSHMKGADKMMRMLDPSSFQNSTSLLLFRAFSAHWSLSISESIRCGMDRVLDFDEASSTTYEPS